MMHFDVICDPLSGYQSEYIRVGDLAPQSLVDVIFEAAIWPFDDDWYPDRDQPGATNIKHTWGARFDILFSYQCGYTDEDGDYTRFRTPDVRALFWGKSLPDLADEVPNLEPALVMFIEHTWPDEDDIPYDIWVRADYLKQPEGVPLANELMRARLSVSDDTDSTS